MSRISSTSSEDERAYQLIALPDRRSFLAAATGALAAAFRARAQSRQNLHRDFETTLDGVEYFVLGNGSILAALQVARQPGPATQGGVLVMSPERFGRKFSTFLFVPERGLRNSRAAVWVDGVEYAPEPGTSEARWEYPDEIPTVTLTWGAGACRVREQFWCPAWEPALVRTIGVENPGTSPVSARLIVRLDANRVLFDEYEVDRLEGAITVIGYHRLTLFSLQSVLTGDRHLEARFESIPPGGVASATFVLLLDAPRGRFLRRGLERVRAETAEDWGRRTHLRTGHAGLDHLFRASSTGLRAAIANSGKMDGSIWQYNFEWVRDQTMAAIGALLAGHDDASRRVFERILTRSVSDDGNTVEAGRFRTPETMELDQNGELLYGLWTWWAWTGDDILIRRYWPKIRAVADYVLRPEFGFEETGLLRNSREFWERDASFGVREGFELAYQVWNIAGLPRAAQMARRMGDEASAARWEAAAARMRRALLEHPRFALIDGGRFIKRRLVTGEVQRTFEPVDRTLFPAAMPLREEKVSYCEPDATMALPVALELVDPASELAQKTLDELEALWNQRWQGGGYGRYHVTSEPDSPGGWPFATMFIARANLEAGNHERVWRALNWLLDAPGGRAGSWLEFYGERPTPPLVPVGIVPWNWAELAIFFVHHLLGVRPEPTRLRIRPRLLSGLDWVRARLWVRNRQVHLTLLRTAGEERAWVNRAQVPFLEGAVELAPPQEDLTVEIHLRN